MIVRVPGAFLDHSRTSKPSKIDQQFSTNHVWGPSLGLFAACCRTPTVLCWSRKSRIAQLTRTKSCRSSMGLTRVPTQENTREPAPLRPDRKATGPIFCRFVVQLGYNFVTVGSIWAHMVPKWPPNGPKWAHMGPRAHGPMDPLVPWAHWARAHGPSAHWARAQGPKTPPAEFWEFGPVPPRWAEIRSSPKIPLSTS